ncbi:MAG: iron-sulfur cluster assembly protein, partial [Anaerolineae bacterium]
MATLEQVRETLTQVMDPELNRNIVDLGMVHDVTLEDGVVTFTLALT